MGVEVIFFGGDVTWSDEDAAHGSGGGASESNGLFCLSFRVDVSVWHEGAEYVFGGYVDEGTGFRCGGGGIGDGEPFLQHCECC